ncbi:hypothetical protein SAMN02746065_110134 [Desulfocicer vacuolatum DSM 3385]|uniref:Uncharacterized protein n=1 Tax=Desulfocicer vacuolatum DSM 3385 TaxID=1121400 RepID=A0A1W2C4D3_9BACT|nr:hypothetical protein [Desulfocicer vacuolatum]SMC80023.1 hypothetical protein SAMN02746065_110134 [Desulfocicer vacuolatum DSM 3385]
MKFKRIVDGIVNDMTPDDSLDTLDCFGEFSKTDKVCTCYCSASIQCAVEHAHNTGVDLFEELLTMNHFPARMQ